MPSASIAIDGPVASGKSTAARAVAERLGLRYVDTGAMYRILTLAALRAGVDPADEAALVQLLRDAPISIDSDPGSPLGYRARCGAVDAGPELFADEVSAAVSIAAAHAGVRAEMVRLQRILASRGPLVMAGRDIGTVVLPEAPCKVFLTASTDTRTARRAAELTAEGRAVDRGSLRSSIAARDRIDSSRSVAPLRPASDSTIIDSTELTFEQVVERIVELARQRLPQHLPAADGHAHG